LTACANDSVSQERDQEETCGLIMGAETKANEGIQQSGMAVQQGGSTDRVTQALESASLDIRNRSFKVSDNQENPDTGETIPRRTALQVHAAYFEDMSKTIDGGIEAMQSFDPDSFEAEGMEFTETIVTINDCCTSYHKQQTPEQLPEQMPEQQLSEGSTEDQAPEEEGDS